MITCLKCDLTFNGERDYCPYCGFSFAPDHFNCETCGRKLQVSYREWLALGGICERCFQRAATT